MVFINAALGETNEQIFFYLPNDSNIGWITAVASKAKSSKAILCDVNSTAEKILEFKPGFVKIDVEGFETFVLSPFLDFINKKYQPTFLVELGWGKSNPHWIKFLDFAKRIHEKGYVIRYAKNYDVTLNMNDLESLNKTIDVIIQPIS